MGIILWFLVGVVVGAGGMFFVYKNNKDKFQAAADEMELKFKTLQQHYEDEKERMNKE